MLQQLVPDHIVQKILGILIPSMICRSLRAGVLLAHVNLKSIQQLGLRMGLIKHPKPLAIPLDFKIDIVTKLQIFLCTTTST